MSVRFGNSIIADKGGYDWIGTLAQYNQAYESGQIAPDWICFITDDVSPDYIANVDLSNLSEEGEAKLGKGAGLEIGDIGTALYIDETKGLRRRLNGSILEINENTQAFLEWLKKVGSVVPQLFVTEETWNSEVALSKFGQCGKFVLNEGARTIRLPKVVNIQGLQDLTQAGVRIDESLPNITGSHTYRSQLQMTTTTGAFKASSLEDTGSNAPTLQTTASSRYIMELDASLSSSTYRDNAPVQQEAIQYPYFIQIATGAETQVNIINDIELNNPYSLFDSKYSSNPLNNASWLASNGQRNDGNVYVTVYEGLLVEKNSEIEVGTMVTLPSGTKYVKRGLSVKNVSDTSATVYDFKIDTTTQEFILPTKDGSESLPSTTYTTVAVKASAETYEVTENGFVYAYRSGLQDGNTIYLATSGGIGSKSSAVTGSLVTQNFLPVVRGQRYAVTYSGSTTSFTLRFYPAIGNGTLYFYVGETVQNADLVNAGRIIEQLGGLVEVTAVVIDSYENETSGYRIWSDGYCEQWGRLSATGSVTLLKTYSDTNYNISGNTYDSGTGGGWFGTQNITTSSFNITLGYASGSAGNGKINWKTSGYLAKGEY